MPQYHYEWHPTPDHLVDRMTELRNDGALDLTWQKTTDKGWYLLTYWK